MARCSSRAGYSLMEVMVACGVLVLLVAILAPALYQAQETARSAKCCSNVRQLSVMLWQYASDYNGRIPYVPALYAPVESTSEPAVLSSPAPGPVASVSAAPGAGGPPVVLPPGAKVTLCHIPPGNHCNAHSISVGAAAAPAHLAHGDHLGPCEDVDFTGCTGTTPIADALDYYGVYGLAAAFSLLTCPSDPNPERMSTTDIDGNLIEFYASYNQNLEFSTQNAKLFPMIHPGDTILFFDGIPSNAVGRYDRDKYNTQYATFRHRGHLNAAFVDGHIESLTRVPESRIVLH